MAGSVPAGCFIVGDRAAGCPVRSPHVWTAPPLPVDEFPYYICNGPQPTQFCDSPMSYQLVKQGKLPPLEERLPVPKDVPIIQPLDGIDAIQNWVPHPSSPYHPGEDVAKLNVDFDQAKTREMYDDLDLTAKDADGFRLRTDGSGQALELIILANRDESADVLELVKDQWALVGIKVTIKTGGTGDIGQNKSYMGMMTDFSAYWLNSWASAGTRLAPTQGSMSVDP